MKKNQLYTVEIESYSSEGWGVCRVEGRAVFVPRALVGERWVIRLTKVGASAIFSRGERLLSPAAHRLESACPYFPCCGGCDLWHMDYEEELRFKLQRFNDALRHIGRQSYRNETILGSDEVTRYRNKGIFAFQQKEGLPCAGFYRERSHELIEVERCLIQDELTERLAAALLRFLREHQLPAYDEASGKGLVRHLFCRKSRSTGDCVACVVSAHGFGALTEALVKALREAVPTLTGVVLNINKIRGNTVLAGEFYTLWGRAEIVDRLCGNRFVISPQAFFQVNPPQAEKLYRQALQYASLEKEDLVFDLYCGAGTISLCLAREAGKVIGAEIVPEAVENARENARANGIENVDFFCGDAGDAAGELIKRGFRPRVVVTDPPRKGMSELAVTALASLRPERIVYVSCNPATLSRDIFRFEPLGYKLKEAVAVDMFPRTSSCEAVALLLRVE